VAGLTKQTLISLPIAIFIDAWNRFPRTALQATAVAVAALSIVVGILFICFGNPIFAQLLTSRHYSLHHAYVTTKELLLFMQVPLLLVGCVLLVFWRVIPLLIRAYLIGSLIIGLLLSGGAGTNK